MGEVHFGGCQSAKIFADRDHFGMSGAAAGHRIIDAEFAHAFADRRDDAAAAVTQGRRRLQLVANQVHSIFQPLGFGHAQHFLHLGGS